MRRKLISALATRFEGVEAKTLGRIADRLMSDKTIETDEDVNSAVEEVTFADILKSYGDSRAAEATKSAVSNYEKKHGLKDGKPTGAQTEPDDDEGEQDPDGGDDSQKKSGKSNAKKNATSSNPEIAELMKAMTALSESMKAVNADMQSLKQGRVTEARKARLAEVIKGLRDSQKKAYNRLPLDGFSEEEFESFIDEVTGEVAELDKENKAEGGSFGAPLSGGSGPVKGEATDAEINAIVDGFNI